MIQILGIAAAFLTTAAYVPQAYKTIKTKDTSGLSISTFSLLFLGTILWFAYGLFIKDIPLVLANGFVMILSGIIFYIKLMSLRAAKV
jgi:MtN3 and saliva related transmembrane protein